MGRVEYVVLSGNVHILNVMGVPRNQDEGTCGLGRVFNLKCPECAFRTALKERFAIVPLNKFEAHPSLVWGSMWAYFLSFKEELIGSVWEQDSKCY